MGAVGGGRQPVGMVAFGPARTSGGPDSERAELVEGEDPVGEVVQDLLDPVQLRLAVGAGGFLPCLGALKGDATAGEQAAQGLAADANYPTVHFPQVGDEFAQ
ncbi:hypothetical protein GCM10010313_26530 [Streptomyces violarus]|uniref:Uncharacterized protein n=1 Tax=Streptomyces violarus TaxID=67380 RepID=A0A7W4ZY39_9ACTN|nr:hypothetical protein [Streptomyces violarus]GHD07399.1 hypothetical protein GCM10010313_26530 [Streptomyces violarus]